MRTRRPLAKKENDRIAIARLYLKGKSQTEIAEAIGVDQSTVSRDLVSIHAKWHDTPPSRLELVKAKELAKIDELERVYWQAWEDSKRSLKSTSTGKDGEKIKLGTRSQERNGNPQFLQGVERCISARVRILGLDAPIKTENRSAIALNHDYSNMDSSELSRIYTSKFQVPSEN